MQIIQVSRRNGAIKLQKQTPMSKKLHPEKMYFQNSFWSLTSESKGEPLQVERTFEWDKKATIHIFSVENITSMYLFLCLSGNSRIIQDVRVMHIGA